MKLLHYEVLRVRGKEMKIDCQNGESKQLNVLQDANWPSPLTQTCYLMVSCTNLLCTRIIFNKTIDLFVFFLFWFLILLN